MTVCKAKIIYIFVEISIVY